MIGWSENGGTCSAGGFGGPDAPCLVRGCVSQCLFGCGAELAAERGSSERELAKCQVSTNKW